jgi:hypothetical protein
MARIPVRVPASDDPDAHGRLAHPVAAVAHAIAGLELLHGDDPGGERHRGTHAERVGHAVGERARAIERDALAHDVAVRIRMREDRGGIGEASRQRDPASGFVEEAHFLFNALGLVRVGEVRHQRNRARDAGTFQPIEPAPRRRERESEAVHARVDLEPGVDRMRGLFRLEHADLLLAVDDGRETGRLREAQVRRVEAAFEEQDRALVAAAAKRHGVFDLERREPVGLRQRARDAIEAVTVGVALDHGEDLRMRRGELREPVVVAQRGGRKGGVDGAGHGRSAQPGCGRKRQSYYAAVNSPTHPNNSRSACGARRT